MSADAPDTSALKTDLWNQASGSDHPNVEVLGEKASCLYFKGLTLDTSSNPPMSSWR